MKIFNSYVSLLLLFCLCFSGCATTSTITVNKFTKVTPEDIDIEIYYSDVYQITKPHTVLAEITTRLKGEMVIRELKQKAVELGADAIIIIRSKDLHISTYSSFWGTSNNVEESGWKALAIKYK